MADADNKKWYPGKIAKTIAARRAQFLNRASSNDDQTSATASVHSNDVSEVYEDSENFSESNPMSGEYDKGEKDDNPNKTLVAPGLAKVSVTIHEVRYLALQTAKINLDFAGRGSVFRYSKDYFPLTKEYELLDIVSDLKIEFKGTHMTTGVPNVCGYVILPIYQALSPVGKPVGIAKKWYEIYPYYDRDRLGESKTLTKFRSGYPDIPGSALVKAPFPLGFVSLEVKITFFEGMKNGLSLYLKPSPQALIIKENQPLELDELADVNEANLALTNARLNRDIDRISTVLWRPFACIAPFLSFPEVFVLIIVFFFFVHSLRVYQLPLAIFFVSLLNGLVAATSRKATPAIWNEPGVTLSFSQTQEEVSENTNNNRRGSLSSPAPDRSGFLPSVVAVVKTSQSLQKRVYEIAHNLEVYSNIFTFADARISVIVYGVFFGISVLLTVFLLFFRASYVVSAVAAAYFLSVACSDFLEEQIAGLTKNSIYWRYIDGYKKYYGLFQTLLSKVPDQLELNHRAVCAAMIVKEGGAEMLDAAPFHEKKEEKKDKEKEKEKEK